MSEETIKQTKLFLLTALVPTEEHLSQLEKFVKTYEVEVKKVENLGERKLAFPVQKADTLLLVSIFFITDGQTAKKIDKDLVVEDIVSRFLLTDWKGDIDPPKRGFRKIKEEKKEVANV